MDAQCIVYGNTMSAPLACSCVWLLHEWHHLLRVDNTSHFPWEGRGRCSACVTPLSDTRWLQITGCNWPGWWAGSRQWKGNRKDSDPFKEANEKDTESLQASRRIRTGSSRFRLMMLQPWGAEKGQGKCWRQNIKWEFTSFTVYLICNTLIYPLLSPWSLDALC